MAKYESVIWNMHHKKANKNLRLNIQDTYTVLNIINEHMTKNPEKKNSYLVGLRNKLSASIDTSMAEYMQEDFKNPTDKPKKK